MKNPPDKLVEDFFTWFYNSSHSKGEDHYKDELTKENLTRMNREEFIDFFYQFARDGGYVQSLGHRTASNFRVTMEEQYDAFREYALEPFDQTFDEEKWLDRIEQFRYFGEGLATIYLNRIDKNRFAIINKKAVEAVELLGVTVPSKLVSRYKTVRKVWQQLIEWYPRFENFFRTDALSQFLIGEDDGKDWKEYLMKYVEKNIGRYWIYAPGERARLWEEFRQKGLMGVGWDMISENLSAYSEKELWDTYYEIKGQQGTGNDLRQLLDFARNIQIGDGIFVKRGTKEIVGYGEVKSDYFYDQSRKEYRHLRRVDWQKSGQWKIPEEEKLLPGKTLTELRDDHRIKLYRRMLELDNETNGSFRNLEYSLAQCAADTYFDVERLQVWKRAIERKKQAIFYGPPGTGKTFVAEKIARHLIGGGDGFKEIVQFHPSYAYEDFMQGLRPRKLSDGALEYTMIPGRFKEFCSQAEKCQDLCVLIVDEINRANLSRVLGELMFLLEYRDQSVPLASGEEFRIPENIRIIGTMNTADRSIALVDHALRRRFAFLGLYPDYQILEKFHKNTDFSPQGLINVLKKLNEAINDKHYSVGISFFLSFSIKNEIADIWQMEIEPYLEELFFDQPQKAEDFSWSKVRQEIME